MQPRASEAEFREHGRRAAASEPTAQHGLPLPSHDGRTNMDGKNVRTRMEYAKNGSRKIRTRL